MMYRSKFLPWTALALAMLLVFVIVFSWIVSSVSPSLSIRSLISGEGVRWFMGGFTSCLSSPLLVWLLVCSISLGTFVDSGLRDVIRNVYCGKAITYRQRHALVISCVLLILSGIFVLLLAFIPHAVLLGATGRLFPSPFSSGIIPLIAFIVVIVSVSYGISCGKLSDISRVFRSLYVGVKMSAPLWPLYILAMQLYLAIMFVFFDV